MDQLSPSAAATARLNDAERVDRIRRGYWIGYGRSIAAIEQLVRLLTHPKPDRMPNLVLCGATNNGKSTIINRFVESREMVRDSETQAMQSAEVIVVGAPSAPDV